MIVDHSSETELSEVKAKREFMRVTGHLQRCRLVYLASPYTLYHAGTDAAVRDIAAVAARLIEDGVSFFSPITHSAPIVRHIGQGPGDIDFWWPLDLPFMESCDALCIALMPGWQDSTGVNKEIEYFCENKKPLHMLPVQWLLGEGSA